MVTLNYMKDDWVKEKTGSRIMQVDEYQIVETVSFTNGSALPVMKRVYNGKVWCTWINENKAVVTQPFLESDLEPAVPQHVEF